jgi:hypothetical protein
MKKAEAGFARPDVLGNPPVLDAFEGAVDERRQPFQAAGRQPEHGARMPITPENHASGE